MSEQSVLKGWRVVEFSHFLAGPSAGQRLAELGAEVVKVETPKGDPSRPGTGSASTAIFETFNRGKKSVTLDLHIPEQEAAAQKLAAGADIVIHNISASSMKKHGLDGATLRAKNPKLIYASVRGYPSNTRNADQKGFDGIGQAESGMISVNGTAESGPLKLPYNPVDIATGLALLQAILVAIIKRIQTGEGCEVETSLLEGALSAQAFYWGLFLIKGSVPERIGNKEPNVAPAAEIMETSDGKYVIFSAYLPNHYKALCELLDVPELVTDERFADVGSRVKNQVELHNLLQEAITKKGWTADEADEQFESIRIAHGRVRNYQEVYDNGLLQESQALAKVPGLDGGKPYETLNAPYRVIGEDRPSHSPGAPSLGADTESVLQELAEGKWDIGTSKVK